MGYDIQFSVTVTIYKGIYIIDPCLGYGMTNSILNQSWTVYIPFAILCGMLFTIEQIRLQTLTKGIKHNVFTTENIIIKTILMVIVVYYCTIDVRYGFLVFVIVITYLQRNGLLEEIKSVQAKQREQTAGNNAIDQIRTILQKRNAKEPRPSTPIPKIIIQTGPNRLSRDHKSYMALMKQHNPDFEHLFFSDDDIETFFKRFYPQYWATYNKLPVFIQKIDFFRYVAVYHYGGFYFDLDVKSLSPIDAALRNHACVFPVDEYIYQAFCNHERYALFCQRGSPFLLGQYAFAAVPKHPFLKLLIDTIDRNLNEYIRTAERSELYVYQSTGPDFVTNLYLDEYTKDDVFILDNGKRQYFGDYGRHDFFGSWK